MLFNDLDIKLGSRFFFLGIAAAIEWQAGDFQKRSGISCSLGRDQATALFRIFQEILTNVARHAQPAKIWVHLEEEHDAIVLEVEDDGVGISQAQLKQHRSSARSRIPSSPGIWRHSRNRRNRPAKAPS